MLLSTAAAGLVAAAVSPASAGEVEKSMKVSGHINRLISITDDGENTTIGQSDNANVSGSRARIVASAKSESMTIGATTELGIQANPGLSSQSDSSTTSINLRHSYISVGNSMGTLYVGHTWGADWLATSNSMSGTGNAGFYDGSSVGGEELHVKNNTATGTSGVSVASVLPNFTGYRKSGIKYVTPNMSGFTAEVGFSEQSNGAASLRYSGDFDGTKVAATAAWGGNATTAYDANWGGSVAVGLAGGLNASVAYSQRDLAPGSALKDPEMWGASIGYKMGANGITAWWQNVQDNGANGNDATAYALVAQHVMKDYGTTIYGGIQNTQYDTPATATQYDDLTAGWVGIRVNF
jgi:hypothetical protein